ncbi:MAG: hypothetical protein ABW148_16915 [Sedimenticola sp.]
MDSDIEAARQSLQSADALFITAGAGMGVDSGLPDFCGDTGFWNAYPIARRLGLSFTIWQIPSSFKPTRDWHGLSMVIV